VGFEFSLPYFCQREVWLQAAAPVALDNPRPPDKTEPESGSDLLILF
jgi:hypothetical protein